jgi:small conductance mechanosensitive channel
MTPAQVEVVMQLAFQGFLSALGASVILILGWTSSKLIARLAKQAVGRAMQPSPDPVILALVHKFSRIGVLLFTLVAVLHQFGVQTTSLVAALGAAGLAIGLALQGTLSNVASGVMLLVMRPFTVGDTVRIGSEMLIVEDIGLFVTRGHLIDGPRIVFPNTQIWNTPIVNFSCCFNGLRRLNEVFPISSDSNVDAAIEALRKTIESDSRILREPVPEVDVSELGPNGLAMNVRAYTSSGDWFKTKLDFTRHVKAAFDRAGVSIAPPHIQVMRHGEKSS